MKSKFTSKILGIMATACLLSMTGCSGTGGIGETGKDIPPSNIGNQINNSDGSSQPESSENNPSGSAASTPSDQNNQSTPTAPPIRNGAPTIFIGPDGEPVCDGDVTELINNYIDNFNKTPAEITAEDEGTRILCDGFQYFKEPVGTAYNSYDNPEMFGEYEFKGEMPENNNPWKRVNVGDEICGLKLKFAVSQFQIQYGEENDFEKRGTYYDCSYPDAYQYSGNNCLAEFEGSLTLTGFLSSSPKSFYFPDGGFMDFLPIEDKLPVMCYDDFKTQPETYFTGGSDGLLAIGESSISININRNSPIKNQQNIEFIGEKPGIGDTVLARVTISNIRCGYGYYQADFSDVEILSDVLAHEEGDR